MEIGMNATLQRVILSYPSVISLTDTGTAPRSWIQLAGKGLFVSKRYGKFSITREDLAQMLLNWRQVTPKAPTELPVDWGPFVDAGAEAPGRRRCGGLDEAAGTARERRRIVGRSRVDAEGCGGDQEPRVSIRLAFVREGPHADGTKIGTTLLAAAITSHPFLEGMQALTLSTPAIAGVHLSVALGDLVATGTV
jgi:hypothetical protein